MRLRLGVDALIDDMNILLGSIWALMELLLLVICCVNFAEDDFKTLFVVVKQHDDRIH